jgi:outer mitochondrial transmembrane helix translocase
MLGATLFGTHYLLKSVMPAAEKQDAVEAGRERFLRRAGVERAAQLEHLNDYECMFLNCVTFPEDISVTFDQIGGLDSTTQQIRDIISLPLERPELFTANLATGAPRSLVSPPRGVLFYGPPGTGKTMTAKAIARECKATFLNVDATQILDKYVGESQRLISSLFSLAEKLQPSIIFLDEVDSLLARRDSGMGASVVYSQITTLFMTKMEGLDTRPDSRVIVLGATNRPNDLDEAILRRFSRQFIFDMPDYAARVNILQKHLNGEPIEDDVSCEYLAKLTPDYSGSDLQSLCREAAMISIHEAARVGAVQPRPISASDFMTALKSVKPSGQVARMYDAESKRREMMAMLHSHANAAGVGAINNVPTKADDAKSTDDVTDDNDPYLRSLHSINVLLPSYPSATNSTVDDSNTNSNNSNNNSNNNNDDGDDDGDSNKRQANNGPGQMMANP